jgi:tRNA G46 methylase TrmB
VPQQPHVSHCAAELARYGDRILSTSAASERLGKWPRERLLICEVGCFDGVLMEQVVKDETVSVVGVDWKAGALIEATDKMKGRMNATMIHGRGQDIACWFAPAELDEVWLFHPDPCDRAVEWKNRLFEQAWLDDVARVLKPGGKLCLKTDHIGYFQWAMASVGAKKLDQATLRRVAKNEWQDESTLPGVCEAAKRFKIASMSVDFWNDQALAKQLSSRAFWGKRSGFEARFARKNWPIYWLELERLST